MTSASPCSFGPALATAIVWLAIVVPATAETPWPEKTGSETTAPEKAGLDRTALDRTALDKTLPRLSVVTAGPADMARRTRRIRRVRLDKQAIDPIQTGSIPKLPPPPPTPAADAQAAVEPVVRSDAQQYCANIASAAADARYAWQAKKLSDLEGQIKQRIADLEAKQAEYKTWLAKREEALKAAEKNLVGIYSKMRPEAASSQLSALDDATAAAVLAQLGARSASAILNEMETKRAARLANAMAGNMPPADQPGKKQP